MASDTAVTSSPDAVTPDHKLRVFISYGHDENAEIAARIRDDLKQRGHEVWFDTERLQAGVAWDARIEKALEWVAEVKPHGRVVLVITPHAVGRPDGYCLNEVAFALDLKLPVVPVVVIWCRPPLSIYRIQRLDMQDCVPLDRQKEQRFEAKLKALLDALEIGSDLPVFDDLESSLWNNLKPLNYDADIKFHFARFTGRRWVFNEIDKWLQETNAARVFWISGSAGTGKSAIATYFCSTRPEVVAFHVCVYGHSEKADPRLAVRSIAYQLTTQFPVYRERLGTTDWNELDKLNTVALFDKLIVTPLSAVAVEAGQSYVIVIDALDEATQGDTNELGDFISTYFRNTPKWLRMIVTARPVPEVVDCLKDVYQLDLDSKHDENRADIREYAQNELSPLKLSGDPKVLAQAVEMIVARSEDLFLYAYWVCEELRQKRLPIEQAESFPIGLAGAYTQFFKRQFPDTQKYENQIAPILAVIAAGFDALKQEIINEIFQLDQLAAGKLFAPLRPLFPCVDGRYRPFHKSILDWLTDDSDKGAGTTYKVNLLEAHARLAEYCWKNCKDRVEKDLRLGSEYQKYFFKHGVRHLVEAKRFADAVNMLDYLFRHERELRPDERNDLNQLAKLVTIALGDKENVTEEEARRVPAEKLANFLKGLYMSEPLYGGVRLLLNYHPDEWPDILEDFLELDDYVLRHTIAEAIGDDYIDTGDPARLNSIYQLLASSDAQGKPQINRQELGAYAVQQVYAGAPEVIDPKYLNQLANGPIYPFRSALGDLLLGLALQNVRTEDTDLLDVMQEVDQSTVFWNPIWKFNRMDVAWLRAVDYFSRNRTVPSDAPEDVQKAYASLGDTDSLRQQLIKDTSIPGEVREALESFYTLGKEPEKIRAIYPAVKNVPDIGAIFEVLFAHPLWLVTEKAASVLASLVDNDPLLAHHICDLFAHKQWRVQYGAAEAAFVARFKNRNQLFRQAINTFYKHPEPLLRGDIAENLAAWILDTVPSKRGELLREFEPQITYWLTNQEEDAWILDHVYRLFHELWTDGLQPESEPLLRVSVSSLMSGDPAWYTLDRQTFLLRIEERRDEQVKKVRAAASARG